MTKSTEKELKKYSPELITAQERRILAAKILLQKSSPFMYTLVSHLKLKPFEDNSAEMNTAAVDSQGNLWWDPEWASSLSVAELAGVLSHEVLHVAFLHLLRLGGRYETVWNISADIKVNQMTQQSGLKLPAATNELTPSDDHNGSVTLKGVGDKNKDIVITDISVKTVEQLYSEILPQLRKKSGKKSLCTGTGGGSGLPNPLDKHVHDKGGSNPSQQNNQQGQGGSGVPHKSPSELEREWKRNLAQAATIARSRGDLPSAIAHELGQVMDARISWRQKLVRYLTSELFADFLWTKPSKKSFAAGAYLPGILKESLDVVVSIDTSGSISDNELDLFMTEVIDIANSYDHVNMTAIVCDCTIKATYDLKGADSKAVASHIKLTGRGGTSHEPVGKWIKENKPSCRVSIHFTDLYTDVPKDRVGHWIWVVPSKNANKEACPAEDTLIEIEE